jgi:hypothetical protein
MQDKEFIAWSKKAKRPVVPRDGEATEKILNQVMTDFEGFKGMLKKYVK